MNDIIKKIEAEQLLSLIHILIALELYEYYFWNERHEFDLQLLK